MKNLRIRGLRSLKDTGLLRIAPITVLLGENSSGKSTFLRTFPLLRQSVEVRTSEPLLWYGRLVDFGSFDESASSFNREKSIEITSIVSILFESGINRVYSRAESINESAKTNDCEVNFKIVSGKLIEEEEAGLTKPASFVSELSLKIFDVNLNIRLKKPGDLTYFSINETDLSEMARSSYEVSQTNSPTPTLYSHGEDISEDEDGNLVAVSPVNTFKHELHKHCKLWMHGRAKDNSIISIANRIRLATAPEILEQIKTMQAEKGLWKKQILEWNIESPDFIILRNLLWGYKLDEIINELARVLQRDFSSISYITPLRAAAERYYRQQGLAVNELDSKGENFAQFLRSLTTRDKESLKKWLGFALGVFVELEDLKGHVSLYLVDERTKSRVNLADTGFGYSQLLPIAVQLWLSQTSRRPLLTSETRFYRYNTSKTIVIEQPELHLHPRIQAKVADILARTVLEKKNKTTVIVETHSEALVNRLGKLVAEGVLTPSDISVVLFNKESFSGPTSISHTEFDSEGFLKDWPLGFFSAE